MYEEGQNVKHQQYGLGTILASDEERTSIEFVEHGTKKFVSSMVVLELTDEKPPKGTTTKRTKKKK
jgi:predicted secreted protein